MVSRPPNGLGQAETDSEAAGSSSGDVETETDGSVMLKADRPWLDATSLREEA